MESFAICLLRKGAGWPIIIFICILYFFISFYYWNNNLDSFWKILLALKRAFFSNQQDLWVVSSCSSHCCVQFRSSCPFSNYGFLLCRSFYFLGSWSLTTLYLSGLLLRYLAICRYWVLSSHREHLSVLPVDCSVWSMYIIHSLSTNLNVPGTLFSSCSVVKLLDLLSEERNVRWYWLEPAVISVIPCCTSRLCSLTSSLDLSPCDCLRCWHIFIMSSRCIIISSEQFMSLPVSTSMKNLPILQSDRLSWEDCNQW